MKQMALWHTEQIDVDAEIGYVIRATETVVNTHDMTQAPFSSGKMIPQSMAIQAILTLGIERKFKSANIFPSSNIRSTASRALFKEQQLRRPGLGTPN
ncbi:MAG: hypothetical protein RRZ24_07075 [Clostridia bacterium]